MRSEEWLFNFNNQNFANTLNLNFQTDGNLSHHIFNLILIFSLVATLQYLIYFTNLNENKNLNSWQPSQ